MTSLLGLPPSSAPPDAGLLERVRDALGADRPPGEAADLPHPDLPALVATLRALEDDAVRRHRSLGLSEGRTAATLADVGRKVATYGADAPLWWLVEILRGDVVAAGRLQVQRVPAADGAALHVPEGGPLTPDAVDEALAEVRRVVGPVPLHCTTWLFDPVLDGLAPTSNIRRLRVRFDVAPAAPSPEGDEDACRFAFRRTVAEVLDVETVHPRTSLERLVAGHLRAGGHWSVPRGTVRATVAA